MGTEMKQIKAYIPEEDFYKISYRHAIKEKIDNYEKEHGIIPVDKSSN